MATEGALAEAPAQDLGDYARFVSPTPSPSPRPDPTPDLGDYGQFVSPAPPPSGGSPTPAPTDLGDYAQFTSPTPHSDNVVAQTHAVADQVDAATQFEIPNLTKLREGKVDYASQMPEPPASLLYNLGIPAPFGEQEGVVKQTAAAIGNLPTDVLNFALSPAGLATAGVLPQLKPIIQRAIAAGFTLDAIRNIFMAPTTQGKIEAGLGGLLTSIGVIKPVGEIIKGKAEVPPVTPPEVPPPITPSDLRPALRTQSGVVPGEIGQEHADLYPKLSDAELEDLANGTPPEHGFVHANDTQNFLDRAQGSAALGETEPLSSQRLKELQGAAPPEVDFMGTSQPETEGGANVPEAAPSTDGGAASGGGPLSIGMASPEEFMQRYAAVGASEILRGNIDPAGFANAVKAQFGSHINDLIPEIRTRAEQLINRFQTATGKTDVTREIDRLVGVTKLAEIPDRVRLFSALKDSLRQQERAGAAGYKRGVKEATQIGNEKVQAMRAKAKTTDQWLAADAQAVRDSLTEYAQNLPLNERGKFIPAITAALKRTPIWSRDPGVMYRRAEAVLNRITESLYNIEKKQATKDIAAALKRIEDSPSVTVGKKQAARQIGITFENLKDKMSFDMLERMHQSILQIEQEGRDLFALNETVAELRTKLVLADMQKEGTFHLDRPVPAKVPIGQEQSYAQRQLERVGSVPNFIRHFNLSWTPMDFVFQLFDQKFNGALYRRMKLPIDVKHSLYLDEVHAYKQRLSDIVQKNSLTSGNLDRITAVAELRQDGGLENLMSRGYTEQELKAIRLTKPELEYLREADKINGELLPQIRAVMEQAFNQEVPDVKGYWPRQRDWDYYNSLSITEGKFSNAMRRVQPEKGHTVSRVEGAVTKNILNAHEIMMKHIDDVVYHMRMAPEIRRAADVIRTDEFKNQVGTWGQKVFADWLDVVARNGGIERTRRVPAIDTLRKNIGMAQLAWRITTTWLQPLSIIDGMAYVSPKEMGRSLSRVVSSENRQWVLDNMPEIKERVGDDPAYTDYQGKSVRDVLARAGFKGISVLDRFAAITVADAAYRDFLNQNGLTFDPKLINMDAVHYAQLMVRKSQSTALPKDVPLAISRGGFSGNATIDKLIGQFQNFMVRRWATVKMDGLQMGIKEKSVSAGARVMSFVILGTVVEQLGREGIKAMTRAIVGQTARDKKRQETQPGFANRVLQNSLTDFITSMPVVSNVVGAIRYEGTGVPLLDVAGKLTVGLPQMVTGKSAYSRGVGAVRSAQAAGALAGIPTGQIGDLVIKWIQSAESEEKASHTLRTASPAKVGKVVKPKVVKSR